MKIISVTALYNEGDILELFIRHHLRFVDHMILVLHGQSVDETHTIAERLCMEGLALTVLRSNLSGHQQSRIVTDALLGTGSLQPDLALMLDCDEFITADAGVSVRHELERLPTDTVTLLPWRTFVPHTDAPTWTHAMTHRRCAETPQFSKVMIPRMFFSPSLRVHQGSHAVSQGDSELPGSMNSVLRLAHVPIRSAAQARQKGLLAWPRQRDNPGHKPGDGFQWQILHDRALQGDHFTHEDIIEIAATYACTRTDVCPALIVDPFTQYVFPA